MLTSAEINAIVQDFQGDPVKVARELVDAANFAGGKDNVSVVFVAGPEFLGSGNAVTQIREAPSRWRRWKYRVRRILGH